MTKTSTKLSPQSSTYPVYTPFNIAFSRSIDPWTRRIPEPSRTSHPYSTCAARIGCLYIIQTPALQQYPAPPKTSTRSVINSQAPQIYLPCSIHSIRKTNIHPTSRKNHPITLSKKNKSITTVSYQTPMKHLMPIGKYLCKIKPYVVGRVLYLGGRPSAAE